jgi:hypothetical protein
LGHHAGCNESQKCDKCRSDTHVSSGLCENWHRNADIAPIRTLRTKAGSVNAYRLPANLFFPPMHVQCQHALLPVVDALPHFKAFTAAFWWLGRSGAVVRWPP